MVVTLGTRLGPYEITARIGAGGMGEVYRATVYRATDTNLKRAVAIKMLPDALATDADRLASFQHEAEVLELTPTALPALASVRRESNPPSVWQHGRNVRSVHAAGADRCD